MSEYYRPVKEKYGLSTVELREIEASDSEALTEVVVDGKRILLPILDVRRYEPNSHCYVFIERMKQHPVTMIDVIYLYREIDFDNENDRNSFLRGLTRTFINDRTRRLPGIFLGTNPAGSGNQNGLQSRNAFEDALRKAVQDAKNLKIFGISNSTRQGIKLEQKSSKKKQDGVALEMAKYLCDFLTLSKPKKPAEAVKKEIEYSVYRSAIFMKSGAMITGDDVSGKYFINFSTDSRTSEPLEQLQEESVSDSFSIYLDRVDDTSLYSSQDYLAGFGDIILSSHILETLSTINRPDEPLLFYGGHVDFGTKTIGFDEKIQRYFEMINDAMFYDRDRD